MLLAPSDHMIADAERLCRGGEDGPRAPRARATSSSSAWSPTARTPATAISRSSAEQSAPALARQALRGEAVAGGGRSLSRQRRLLLERRHLSLQGQRPCIELIETHAPEILAACRARARGRDRATSASWSWATPTRKRRPSRSTTPSPRRPTNLRCVPLASAMERCRLLVGAVGLPGEGPRPATSCKAKARSSSRIRATVSSIAITAAWRWSAWRTSIVVAMEDAVLVASQGRGRGRSSDVVERLKGNGRTMRCSTTASTGPGAGIRA